MRSWKRLNPTQKPCHGGERERKDKTCGFTEGAPFFPKKPHRSLEISPISCYNTQQRMLWFPQNGQDAD
jgi:hypothetical protein